MLSPKPKEIDAGAYKMEKIPDMADVGGKRFDYMTEKLKINNSKNSKPRF
ncbi:MAG: hypothetical protein R2796_08960 [Chitinophagaceae bacterium]